MSQWERMVPTLIEPQLSALQAPAAGDLAITPLPELLFAHAAAGSTGTLRINDERGVPIAAVRFAGRTERGGGGGGVCRAIVPDTWRSARGGVLSARVTAST